MYEKRQNREIKFRAWNAKEQLMSDPFGLIRGTLMWRKKGETAVTFASLFPEYIVMQYTGLKDKNGKEIYEGDLLAEIDKIDELNGWGRPLIVEFGQYSDGPDGWGLGYGTTGFLLRYHVEGSVTGLHTQGDNHYGFNHCEMMIVGNIYEHSHLLNNPELSES